MRGSVTGQSTSLFLPLAKLRCEGDETHTFRQPPDVLPMLRPVLTLFALAAASPALAQPCEVTIARAPDAIRAEIEAWVRSEPRCATSLEVRVVESSGGLYVFARDGRGFTRQRMVPDGATVAALIASWIADDSIDGVWLPEAPPNPPVLMAPPGLLPATPRADAHARAGRNLRVTGLGIGAAGLVAITAGVYFGVRANEISAEISSHSPTEPWSIDIAQREAQGRRDETRQYALLAAGGGLVATGALVYLVGRAQAKQDRLTVAPTATARGDVGLAVAGRF